MGMGNTFGPGKQAGDVFIPPGGATLGITGDHKKVFGRLVMRVTTISQEETGCGQADCSIMPGTCKLHGPASHCALAFLLDAALPSAGGNSPKYAKSMLFEGTKMLGALIMWFAGRDQQMQVHHRECCSMS